MITIRNLNKSYGRRHVLYDINLQLDAGQRIAFVGPNGCGKSTLMKCILGLVTPQTGEVLINGANVQDNPACREQIGFMQQNSAFPENMSVGEVFRTIKSVRGRHEQLDEELYRDYDIASIARQRTGTLSGGTSQKVNAALAFLFNPNILILDEPTASLDPIAADILKRKIKRETNKLVFITSHILSELQGMVTHVIFMDEGRVLFFKSVEQLLAESGQPDVTQAVMTFLNNNNK